MNLIAIEAPAARVAPARETLELLNASLRVVTASYGLQVVPNKLVEALAESRSPLSGPRNDLLVEGQGHIHRHIIRVHISCVNPLAKLAGCLGDLLWCRRWSPLAA